MAELFLVEKAAEGSAAADDSQARLEALDTRRSFLVEAPAGSGKTGLLIQRFLKLLAAENVDDPAQVLAITFTRKATADVRDRVLAHLRAAAEGGRPADEFGRLTRPLAVAALAQDRRLGWNLLGYPRRLNIRTIDSVGAEIARSLPVLSGGPAGLMPREQAGPLYAEAARRTLMLLGGEDAALTAALETILLHRDGNLAEFAALIAEMLEWREQWGGLIPLSPAALDEVWLEEKVLPKLEKALDQAICRGLTRLDETIPGDVLRRLCALASEMGQAEGYRGRPSPIAVCAGKVLPPDATSQDFERWRALVHLLLTPSTKGLRAGLSANHLGFAILPEHRTELERLIKDLRSTADAEQALCQVDALPPAKYPREQWVVTKALFRVLSRALIELQFVFAEGGMCDFAELGLLARAALGPDAAGGGVESDLTRATGHSLQHLLVDEMQDTSTSQYELIQLLTQGWDGRSQTVFLVGDPKQSIYLFRQARVERFVETMRHGSLGELPLSVLHLTANFRSQAHLVDAFNEDFPRVFASGSTPGAPEVVPYLAAQARRKPGMEVGRRWHPSALAYSDEQAEGKRTRERQRQADAEEIRRRIERWRRRPLPRGRSEPWKIAVLVRERAHLVEVFKALKEREPIPYRAVEIEPLGERQEILDLLALTRALLHPGDRTAWLALLRTPWCGLGLAELHLLAGGDQEDLRERTVLELMETRSEQLSPEGRARLAPFHAAVRSGVSLRGRLALAPWVERTWRSFDAEAYASEEEVANIERFLNLLEEMELPGGSIDLAALGERLGKLYATASIHPGAVDLMTIHGAKGLEWDVVLVPALERAGRVPRGRLLSWLEVDGSNDVWDESMAHGILAPIKGKGEASKQLNRWMRRIEAEREAAERKRLFYVACTRAREELHLFAAPERRKHGGLKPAATSVLEAVWAAAEEHFQAQAVPPVMMRSPGLFDHLEEAVESLAAGASEPARVLYRIPLRTLPDYRRMRDEEDSAGVGFRLFDRPEGSFGSRAFGNAVHAFLEQVTSRRAAGQTAEALLQELPGWLPRITQVLRASGLAPAQLEALARRVVAALRNTLMDAAGRWILAPHPEGRTESSCSFAARERGAPEGSSTVRLDRTFRAGTAPLSTGDECLWVIDYKTSALGGRELQCFVAEEREKYRGQMKMYAAAVGGAERGAVRLALYYPLLPALICYEPETIETESLESV